MKSMSYDNLYTQLAQEEDQHPELYLFDPVDKTKEIGRKILANMPSNLKKGTIFIDDSDILIYISIIILSCAFFFAMYPLVHLIVRKCKDKTYLERMETDPATAYRYVGYWVVIQHHAAVSIYLIWAMSEACSEGSEFPVAGFKGGLLWFRSSQCMLQPSRTMTYGVCFSIGYLFYDIYYQAYQVQMKDPMIPQMIAHHVLAIVALVVALLSGYDMIGVAAGFMMCEISSVFLTFKSMTNEKNRNSPLAVLNQITFLITYTMFRIIFFPALGLHIIPGTIAVWDVLPGWRKAFTIISYLLGFTVLVLNIFWYVLIIKGVYKMMLALGFCGGKRINVDKQEQLDEELNL